MTVLSRSARGLGGLHGLRALLAVGLAAGGLGLVPATEAAASSSSQVSRTTWAYTDSQEPLRSFADGQANAPVGAWRDAGNRVHKAKSYFTFDLPDLGAGTLVGAQFLATEASANDCTKPRRTEVWHTETATAPTWASAPRERSKLTQTYASPGCVAQSLYWDAGAAAQAAYAGSRRLTIAMRMPGDVQDDVRYGRAYRNNPTLVLQYNLPPEVPRNLTVDYRYCQAEPPLITNRHPLLEATVRDPDPYEQLTAQFAIWPTDAPAERTEYTTGPSWGAQWLLPDGFLAHDREYTWTVRASDGRATSDWAPPCRFRTDFVVPRTPLVHSETYPEGGTGGAPGVPGQFVISPDGDTDIVGYNWRIYHDTTFVPADGPGGSATITFRPASAGWFTLYFDAVDRAGQRSPVKTYEFFVQDPTPSVVCEPFEGYLDDPRECTFTPNMANVVSWSYTFNNGELTTVPAGPDGTARVSLTPTQGLNMLYVTSQTADGDRSPTAVGEIGMFTNPLVDCAGGGELGDSMDCTFQPHWMRNVVSYAYQVNDGPQLTLPADAEGTARATIVLDRLGNNEVTVVATDDQGRTSEPGRWSTYLSTTPTVHSDTYPYAEPGGGVGVPGEFVFGPGRMPGVVEYVYTFDNELTWQTIAADGNGAASVTFTPDQPWWQNLIVYSRTADGTESDRYWYSFVVAG